MSWVSLRYLHSGLHGGRVVMTEVGQNGSSGWRYAKGGVGAIAFFARAARAGHASAPPHRPLCGTRRVKAGIAALLQWDGRPSIDSELLIRINLAYRFFKRAWCVNSIRSMRGLAGRRLGGFQASLRARRLMPSADRMGWEGSGRPSVATRSADGVSCRNQRCGLFRPPHPPGCRFPL